MCGMQSRRRFRGYRRPNSQVNQFDNQNPEASLVYLATTIRSHPTSGGFTMSQEPFVRDVLKTWDMPNCRPLPTPGETGIAVELPSEGTPEEVDPDDVLRAQKSGGSLIWLSTRTRRDIS